MILPRPVEGMFQGVRIRDVVYRDGGAICPVCGIRTPVGVPGDFLQFFNSNITMEQWSRTLHPGNVNRIMNTVSPYAVDPLCLGEAILRGGLGSQFLITLTLRAPTPLGVLEEVGRLGIAIIDALGARGPGIPRAGSVEMLFPVDDLVPRELESVLVKAEGSEAPQFVYDAFSSVVVLPYRGGMRSHQDEWVKDVTVAGVLASWGLYPLTVSEAIPSAPSEALLTYSKGRKPLYDYEPRRRNVGGYTPYVAASMAALAWLNARAGSENLPAVLEILDYPPRFAPAVLQYASPRLYAGVSGLLSRVGVGA